MRVAIATDNGTVSPHFGRCGEYTLFTIEDGEIKNREVLENPGHEPGKIPSFLSHHNVGVIIAGGMGRRAQMLFDEMGIKHILGAIGTVDSVINQFCDGSLSGGESLCSGGGHEHSGDCHH
jgi:predicted Fe-Mo cluster-binding NifX family protein